MSSMKPVVAFGALVALQGCGEEEPKATTQEIAQDGELQQFQENVEGAVDTVAEQVKKVVSASKIETITAVQEKVQKAIADLDVEHLAEEHKADLETIKATITDGLANFETKFEEEISHQDWQQKLGEMQTLLTKEWQKFDTAKLEATFAETFEQAQKTIAEQMQDLLPMTQQEAKDKITTFIKDSKATTVTKEHFAAVAVLVKVDETETKDLRNQAANAAAGCFRGFGGTTYQNAEAFEKKYRTTDKDGNVKLTPFEKVIPTKVNIPKEVVEVVCKEAQSDDQCEKVSRKNFLRFLEGALPKVKEAPEKAIVGGKKVESKEEAPKEAAEADKDTKKEKKEKKSKGSKKKRGAKKSSKTKKE